MTVNPVKRKVAMPAEDKKNNKAEAFCTPISDFIREYEERQAVRAHMPGHKGLYDSLCPGDITEIEGADSLYAADGIILKSEKAASKLFGSGHSFFVTEGSSQAVKAMCLMAMRLAGSREEAGVKKPVILAGRNAHRSFVSAAELLGFEIGWLLGENRESLMECRISKEKLEERLEEYSKEKDKYVAAVYVTSPDYLGNTADIKGLSELSHEHGTILIVDNAHGAYLRFLKKDSHPLSLGADMVCDSAHKTLPVLTGGAYLHVSKILMKSFDAEEIRSALLRFGSTSPSYLILRSLDLANRFLYENKTERYFDRCCAAVSDLKAFLVKKGIVFAGDEPMKLCIDLRKSGLSEYCDAVVNELRKNNIEPEFCDRDYITLMLSPFNSLDDYEKIKTALTEIMLFDGFVKRLYSGKAGKEALVPAYSLPEKKYEPSEILGRSRVKIRVDKALGRVAANVVLSCPPAILPVIPGEIVDGKIIRILKYYGIKEIYVL